MEFWHKAEKSGWLQSQGEHLRTWRRRWFVLKQGFLFRFADQNVVASTKPRGIVDLSKVTDVVSGREATGKNNSITLSTANGSVSLFLFVLGCALFVSVMPYCVHTFLRCISSVHAMLACNCMHLKALFSALPFSCAFSSLTTKHSIGIVSPCLQSQMSCRSLCDQAEIHSLLSCCPPHHFIVKLFLLPNVFAARLSSYRFTMLPTVRRSRLSGFQHWKAPWQRLCVLWLGLKRKTAHQLWTPGPAAVAGTGTGPTSWRRALPQCPRANLAGQTATPWSTLWATLVQLPRLLLGGKSLMLQIMAIMAAPSAMGRLMVGSSG